MLRTDDIGGQLQSFLWSHARVGVLLFAAALADVLPAFAATMSFSPLQPA
jgi:hypothetical protein